MTHLLQSENVPEKLLPVWTGFRGQDQGRCCSEACAVFFLNAMPRRSRNSHTVEGAACTPLGGKALSDLGKRDIRRLLDQAENEGLIRIEL
jgi:hypothetical protein